MVFTSGEVEQEKREENYQAPTQGQKVVEGLMNVEQLRDLIGKFEEQEKILPGSGAYQVGVLESMLAGCEKWGNLTPRQLEFVNNLKQSIDSPVELSKWKEEFLSSHREKFNYVVRYYTGSNTNYFSETVRRAQESENFIPSRKNYEAITTNKYASRVLEEMLEKSPKHSVGDVIQMRDTYSRRDAKGQAYHHRYDDAFSLGGFWREPEKGWCYIVLENDIVPVNACIGCRRYKLLPFGDGTIITTEERWIKKARV